MRKSRIMLAGAGAAALLVAWQTIQAVGSHVPIEERRWVPPTVAEGLAGDMMLAGHGGPGAGPAPHFDIAGRGDGVTAPGIAPAAAANLDALRYFAQAGDTAAMAREIARLERTHPGLALPERLRRPAAGPSEQPLWDLFADGRYAAVRRAIARMKADHPGFRPSPDLVAKLEAAEARTAIDRAAAAERWAAVVEAARGAPHLLICARMQTLWHLATAYGRTGAKARALDVYRYILTHCDDRQERHETVRKASALMPVTTRRELLPMVRRDGGSPPPALRRTVLRAVLAGGLRERADTGESDEAAPVDVCAARAAARAPTRASTGADEAERERAATALAKIADSAAEATALGWHHAAANRFDEARAWFARALSIETRLEALEGLVIALDESGARDEARRIARANTGEGEGVACLYVALATADLAAGRLDDPAHLEALARELRSAEAAQVIGWHTLDAGDARRAREWFARSVRWGVSEAAALGLAVTAERLGDRRAAQAVAARYGARFAKVAAFVEGLGPPAVPVPRERPEPGAPVAPVKLTPGAPAVLLQDAIAAYEAGDYARTIARLEARRAFARESRDIAMLRGWALHNAGRAREAYDLFRALDAERSTPETRAARRHAWRKLMPRRFH